MRFRFSPVSFILIAYLAVAANATDNTTSPSSSCSLSTTTETVTYYPTTTSSCPLSTITKTVTYTPTNTPAPSCQPVTHTISLRRMWNAQLTVHFYSTYGLEVEQFGGQGYVEEKPQGRVFATQVDGTVPLLRCTNNFDISLIDHIYTADFSEWQALVAAGCQVMPDPPAAGVSQGIGYLYTSPVCGAVPLYRLYSSAWSDHFYTIDTAERQSLLNSGLYADQGITGYVIPN